MNQESSAGKRHRTEQCPRAPGARLWRRGNAAASGEKSAGLGPCWSASAGRSPFVKRRALTVDDEREREGGSNVCLLPTPIGRGRRARRDRWSSAVAAIQKLQPDVYSRCRDARAGWLCVLDSLPQDEWPVVIFTTAYGHYANPRFRGACPGLPFENPLLRSVWRSAFPGWSDPAGCATH